jgi:hypothetical protein
MTRQRAAAESPIAGLLDLPREPRSHRLSLTTMPGPPGQPSWTRRWGVVRETGVERADPSRWGRRDHVLSDEIPAASEDVAIVDPRPTRRLLAPKRVW